MSKTSRLFAIFCILSLPRYAITAEIDGFELKNHGNDLGGRLLGEMLASSGNLQSGSVHYQQYTWGAEGRPDDVNEYPIHKKIFCVLDLVNDRIRYDLQVDNKADGYSRLSRYVSTASGSYLYTPDTGVIQELHPNQHLDSDFGQTIMPFQIIGMSTRTELEHFRNYRELHDFFRDDCVTEGQDLGGGKFRLTLYNIAGSTPVKREFILDSSKNYVPVRYHGSYYLANADGGEWAPPATRSEVEWEKVNGVWLPSQYFIETGQGDSKVNDEYLFEWESVNDKVSDEYFSRASLKAENGTLLVDMTLVDGTPVIVSQINDGSTGEPATKSSLLKSGSFRIYLVIGGTILFAILVMYIVMAKSSKNNVR